MTTPTPIFNESVHTKSESHTKEYLAERILEIIDEIGPSKILAVLTNSASDMIKVR